MASAAARVAQLLALLLAVAVVPSLAAVKRYDLHITLASAAPDCFERPVLMVNGQMGFTLEVTQGDILEVLVINDIPESYPEVLKGISVHWHGFHMKGNPWFDGVGYVEQCPIAHGSSMLYRFPVNEVPGTYFWHAHTGADRADGLSGPIIVRPRDPTVVPLQYDEERTLLLNDWWHTASGALAMPLNRPFDAARQTNDSGGWNWVQNPQSILINSKGYYADCAIGAAGSTAEPTCAVTQYSVPPGRSAVQPWASAVNPGCSHHTFTVESGKTYLFRIINAANLLYQTVCFGGHDVRVVAADAHAIEPFTAPNGCIDVNSGQRYDVLLTADKLSGNYWVSSLGQYRPGSPAGYAVLHYADAPNALPASQPPQPGSVAPWTPQQENSLIKMNAQLLARTDTGVAGGVYADSMSQVPNATLQVNLGINQPLMQQTAQLRWGINNVVNQLPPACTPLLDLVQRQPNWIAKNVVPANSYNSNGFKSSALGTQYTSDQAVEVFLTTPTANGSNSEPPPIYPTAGTHILPLKRGEVLEVVLQNLAANANNGDYRVPAGASRTAMEQHPFHLHGHHFWLLGTGLGTYDPATSASSLNLVDPPLRDTVTLPRAGWAVFRVRADNPGLWLLHCHLLWHEWMGQALARLRRPRGLPQCPKICTANSAPWSNKVVNEKYGESGFQLPAGR